jgi:hypothetical protein
MIKVILILYRLAVAAILALGSLLYFSELFYISFIMMLLFLLIGYGLWSNKRWTMIPIVLVMIFLTLVTAAMTIGNIAWPEHLIAGIGLAYVFLMILEGATLAFVVSEGHKIMMDGQLTSHSSEGSQDKNLLSPSGSSS